MSDTCDKAEERRTHVSADAALYDLRVAFGRKLVAEDERLFGEISADVRAQVAAEWRINR
jgi:hypothetical protein